MGYLAEYIQKGLDFKQLEVERHRLLDRIGKARGTAVMAYCSDVTKAQSPIILNEDDLISFDDQLSHIRGDKLDLILETPGGLAYVVEDLVDKIRSKFDSFSIIIPGTAKSAGTIMAMAADEILMGPGSSLGPIDAQLTWEGKVFSAGELLDGIESIKNEAIKENKLNVAYVPILQRISPGEIERARNAQALSQTLVTKWLKEWKFKNWKTHSSTGADVTSEEKEKRAQEIASCLCDHKRWLTHSRSIKLKHLQEMRLMITDFSAQPGLNESLQRYYALMKMTFASNTYKIFETAGSVLYRQQDVPGSAKSTSNLFPSIPANANKIVIDFVCAGCKSKIPVQVNLAVGIPVDPGKVPYPSNNHVVCPACGVQHNLMPVRAEIEKKTGKPIIV